LVARKAGRQLGKARRGFPSWSDQPLGFLQEGLHGSFWKATGNFARSFDVKSRRGGFKRLLTHRRGRGRFLWGSGRARPPGPVSPVTDPGYPRWLRRQRATAGRHGRRLICFLCAHLFPDPWSRSQIKEQPTFCQCGMCLCTELALPQATPSIGSLYAIHKQSRKTLVRLAWAYARLKAGADTAGRNSAPLRGSMAPLGPKLIRYCPGLDLQHLEHIFDGFVPRQALLLARARPTTIYG
jgi:hypothetical protein